jgi:hypothetical protein
LAAKGFEQAFHDQQNNLLPGRITRGFSTGGMGLAGGYQSALRNAEF